MQSKTIKKTLMCALTDSERREYGISLATTLGDMEEIEAQKKREMDHFKDRLAGMQAKADELSRKVRDGKEWRDVECVVMYSMPDKEHKQTVRLDTGETVQTELMTATDLQLVMPLDLIKDAMDPGDRLGVGELQLESPAGGVEVVDGDGDEEDGVVYRDGPEDEEPKEEDEHRELPMSDISALLITLEGWPKLQRKKRLTDLLHIHGRANLLKFTVYETWNDADPHMVKAIKAMIKEVGGAQPELQEAQEYVALLADLGAAQRTKKRTEIIHQFMADFGAEALPGALELAKRTGLDAKKTEHLASFVPVSEPEPEADY